MPSAVAPRLRRGYLEGHGGQGRLPPSINERWYLRKKTFLLIPAMVAIALRADGWYLRSDIIWHKASHLPESVRDRPTACHEHVFLLSKSKTYYYDSESIAEDCASSSEFSDKKNARDVWVIAPKPCTLAHFAVMPLDLAERCVKAGSSRTGAAPPAERRGYDN